MLAGTATGTGTPDGQLGDRGELQGGLPGGASAGGRHQANQLIVGQAVQAFVPDPVGDRGQPAARLHPVQHPARGEPAAIAAVAVGEPGIQHLGHRVGRSGQPFLGGHDQPFRRRIDIEVVRIEIGRVKPSVHCLKGRQLRGGQLVIDSIKIDGHGPPPAPVG